MSPAELRALAKRVAEEQPSRELDVEVHVACGLGYATHNGHVAMGSSCGAYGVGHYTTSLDAAAPLMPKGWRIVTVQGNPYRIDNPGTFWVSDAVRTFIAADGKPDYREVKACAPTEPQARTAGALLAMAADMEARDA